jgi:hypothetical protein
VNEENRAMRASIKPRHPSPDRRKPEAAIPRFRELRLSAVVAACVSPKRPMAEPRKSTDAIPARRFEEG